MKTVGKLTGERGMVPKPYHYLGPGNPLMKQVVLDNKGRIKKYIQKPYNKLDRIASKHDVCYHNNKKNKNACDYEMVREMRGVDTISLPKRMKMIVDGLITTKGVVGI